MIKRTSWRIVILFSLIVFFPPCVLFAKDLLLYDATVEQLPGEQDWLMYFSDGISDQQLVGNTGVQLQTALNSHTGYSNYNVITQSLKNSLYPSLDIDRGVVLQFDLQINSENHETADRAGFSIILLDNNHQGVEIGFWEDEIWSQADDPLFTHGESVDFVTTGAMKSYILTLTHDSYSLYQGGEEILTGLLKDYSAFTGYPNPYEIPNFLFLGDNTTSAQADVNLGSVMLQSDTQLKNTFSWTLFFPSFLSSFQILSDK